MCHLAHHTITGKLRVVLKILGGQFRSRKLKTPRDNDVTRPWTGRARESVMNQLRGHLVKIQLFLIYSQESARWD